MPGTVPPLPRVLVLGTAQDGGIPHPGCACVRCAAARSDPARRRLVASIAVVGASGRVLLVDATPDLTEQTARLAEALGRRGPGFDELLLTHAHVGHYLGLAMLGREAMGSRAVPLHVTGPMEAFLRANRPWAHLVERGQVDLRRIGEGPLFRDGVEVTAFQVPHRAEDTDTVGVEVRGPSRTLVYVPDADLFPPELGERIGRADAALVDGTFWSPDELPGAVIEKVPHPFVREVVRRGFPGTGEVWFTHLNHTNPLLGPDRPRLPERFSVAREGQEFGL